MVFNNAEIKEAADKIRRAKTVVITAGAGIGVDSGLPDFRGDHGFWNAYPVYKRLGLSFQECANPEHFKNNPKMGWGFYGHRTELYRKTKPHKGFELLREWTKNIPHFIVTSNVDGHFQKAGFDPELVREIHGSINHLQCVRRSCGAGIWENNESFDVDKQMMAQIFPVCHNCGMASRPNILMFRDVGWNASRVDEQTDNWDKFWSSFVEKKPGTVVIEIGARKIHTIN